MINAEDELVPLWECARANQWIDPKSGSKVRYALLVSTCVDEEIGLVDRSLSESSDMADFLEGFHEIHRTGKKYERTENGTFVEA